ncbi:hypothetical protein [Enterobacter kobei]|uniref:hypothetical protein n=1 Tax=Enterobacter kobei TaxID=208224 RepID=UPI002A83F3BA|nr:hypothetical protein [Enterobacter kobei]
MSDINPGDMVLIISGPGTGCSAIAEGMIGSGESERVYSTGSNAFDVTITNPFDYPFYVVSNGRFVQPVDDVDCGEMNLRGLLLKRRHEILKIDGNDLVEEDEPILMEC